MDYGNCGSERKSVVKRLLFTFKSWMKTKKLVALFNRFVDFIIERRVALINCQSPYTHNFCLGLLKRASEKQLHQRIMKKSELVKGFEV